MKKRKKLKIMGIPVTVVSDEEAAEADYVVCAPFGPSEFDDNLTGFCCKCGCKIMYRWHAPRKPPKICMECAVKNATAKDK